ncbi:(deoxy)nucleoside triphosphate pyrophosphohydrolase [Parolsenella catena]|uniref:(deoxy)nucleoside triphosphate pyrophosphohydrolase n=1 Tax=Parolsenella catena TaxID=2003188 RepID=UPI003F957975
MSDKNLHVAAAIIVRDGAVLAAQRSHGMKDGWELPGGKLEPGETSEDACHREIREELGLELGVLWPFTTVRHSYPEFDIEMDVFCAPIASDAEPQMLDHEALRWLGRDELLSVDWLPADLEVVRSLGLAWSDVFDSMHM